MVNNLVRCLLMLLLGVTVMPGFAQQAATLPDWLVPVVRVLPGDRVVPSTGIYLGDERVLVPSELTVPGGTLLVLDGGADLTRFGRDAVVEQRLNVQGLAILRVAGLERTVPLFAPARPSGGTDIALQAYPPASLIAAGKNSLFLRSSLVIDQGMITLAPDRPLPNVTGALTDACGYWVGHSAARGAASMGSSHNTQYRFRDELQAILEQAGISLPSALCNRPWPDPVQAEPGVLPETVEPKPAAETDPDSAPGQTPEVAEDLLSTPEPAPESAPGAVLPDEAPPELIIEESAQASDAGDVVSDHVTHQPAVWPWWLAGGMVMTVLLTGIILSLRRLNARDPAQSQPEGGLSAQRPEFIPVARLVGSTDEHLLVADHDRVNAVLGRFDADILLRSTSASRQHARLHGGPGALMLEDLGSTNGTWVNAVRCQPFEPVAVQFGDELLFADERYRLEPPAEQGEP